MVSPKLNIKQAASELAKLSLMKFFPADQQARAALLQIVCGIAETNEQIEWLVRRALAVFTEWPGPYELRALYCSRWKPCDGTEAYSALFPATEDGGGFPRDPALPPLPPPLLTPGKAEARKLLGMAADYVESLPEIRLSAPRVTRAAPMPTNPNFRPITQADIDRELLRQRDERARRELGLPPKAKRAAGDL